MSAVANGGGGVKVKTLVYCKCDIIFRYNYTNITKLALDKIVRILQNLVRLDCFSNAFH